MQNSGLLFDHSPWFVLLCLLAGIVYAFLLYQKNGPWSKNTNYFLFGLRFFLVSIVTFLLIGPFIKQVKTNVENPTVVIAIDNSLSMANINDSISLNNTLATLAKLKTSLEEQDQKVEIMTLDENERITSLQEISFTNQKTDLQNLLKNIQSDFEGRNISGTILVTDGIYNQGISPIYNPYSYKIFTVGMGDTVPQIDLNLKNLYFNKIAYQGNKFPVVAEVFNTGFAGEAAIVTIKRNNKILSTKNVALTKSDEIYSVEFLLEADITGIQHYVVEVQHKEGEFTKENNIKHAYIDVVEGKEKVLLVAQSPHPDIKAIRYALEKNENYEISLFIPDLQEHKEEKYDLIIFHQVPGEQANPMVTKLLSNNIPKWFIVGNNTNLNLFNSQNQFMQINMMRGERDKVTPAYNEYFKAFNIKSELRNIVGSFPPVSVPFGNYKFPADSEIILYQKVGNVVTEKPLLVIGRDRNSKTAIMLGDGMWQWRLQEFAKTGKQEAFDELVSKMVQYLSAKDDKRKFKVYPINNEFDGSEPVIIENEVYNDIFERIYNQNIDLELISENGEKYNYNYIVTEANSQYRIGGLQEGLYNLKATTVINNKKESSQGAFTINSVQLESLNLTADHNMLKRLSIDNDGKYFHYSDLNKLQEEFNTLEAKGVITSSVVLQPIINIKWLFFILLILISTEWFIRKYNGSY
ncbi:MAG: VWA domain-containing protein [Bacteroidota bacterium]|nr:VWA domain-containing protein [Bacteroidota bacterium]